MDKQKWVNIPAETAWEQGIPLPPIYNFIYLCSHGTGNTGFSAAMSKYGGFCFYSTNKRNGREHYIDLYQQMVAYQNTHKKSQFCYLAIRNHIQTDDADKFYSLIQAQKALYIARDPISILKTCVNIRLFRDKKIRILTLDSNPQEIVPQLIAYPKIIGGGAIRDVSSMPTLDCVMDWINFRYKTFHDSALINAVNPQEIVCMDMAQIIGKQAFNTYQNLAKLFSFPLQKESERGFFEQKVSKYEGLLPLTLYLEEINTHLFIATKYWIPINKLSLSYEVRSRYTELFPSPNEDYLDISNAILKNHLEIIIIMQKESFKQLKKNKQLFEKVIKYLNELIFYIEKQRQIEDSKALNEQHLLDYLKNNPLLSNKFDNILEEHLAYIKQVRPDIVESWKYYGEFKKICARFSQL